MLTEDMRRVIEAELGFIATVCPDGTPNLSPKGTIATWDDDHLIFADLRSPGTVANLRSNPSIEINVWTSLCESVDLTRLTAWRGGTMKMGIVDRQYSYGRSRNPCQEPRRPLSPCPN